MNISLVLDFDGSCAAMPDAAVIDLHDWQEAIRFGCGWRTYRRWQALLQTRLPQTHGTVLMGSGDFHHVSFALIERQQKQMPASAASLQVVVLDNHPDNMRFPFGIHCGSWVRHVARLPQVGHVHVLGITSLDIGLGHFWENYWGPLYAGKLTYWCMDVNVGWSRYVGLGRAFRCFTDADALIDAFLAEQNAAEKNSAGQNIIEKNIGGKEPVAKNSLMENTEEKNYTEKNKIAVNRSPIYLSIDKDVLSPDAVRTNWDQGKMLERHLLRLIDALSDRIIGSDITGEVSSWQYNTWWKRQLSAMDGQVDISAAQADLWQQQQCALNTRLIAALAACRYS
jgi:hypothetical protein